MGSLTINTCTAPDGTKFKRTSSSGRAYSHAVLGCSGGSWDAVCWNSRFDLSQREASVRGSFYDQVAIVPVTVEEKQTKAKPRVDWPATPTFEMNGLTFTVEAIHYRAVSGYGGYRLHIYKNDSSFHGHAERIPAPGEKPWLGRNVYATNGGLQSRVTALMNEIDRRNELRELEKGIKSEA